MKARKRLAGWVHWVRLEVTGPARDRCLVLCSRVNISRVVSRDRVGVGRYTVKSLSQGFLRGGGIAGCNAVWELRLKCS